MRCSHAVLTVVAISVGLALVPNPAFAVQGQQFTLAPEADLEVGGFGSDVEAELSELAGAMILADGTLLIADRLSRTLKVFDSSGAFIRNVGREGQGPGEFEYVLEIGRCVQGEIWVTDVNQRRHRYTEALEFLTTSRYEITPLGGGSAYNWACNAQGYELVTGWGDFQSEFREGYYQAQAPVLLLKDGELVADFGMRLSSERIGSLRPDGTPAGSGPHPFGRATVVGLADDRAYIGSADGYEIEVYDLAGQRLPSLTWEGPALSYQRNWVEEWAEEVVASASETRRPALRRYYRDLPALEQFPAYDRIAVADDGGIWVRLFPRPTGDTARWVIFGAQHRLLGHVVLPRDAEIWQIVGGRVLYSVSDEFDVPVVSLRRIES